MTPLLPLQTLDENEEVRKEENYKIPETTIKKFLQNANEYKKCKRNGEG